MKVRIENKTVDFSKICDIEVEENYIKLISCNNKDNMMFEKPLFEPSCKEIYNGPTLIPSDSLFRFQIEENPDLYIHFPCHETVGNSKIYLKEDIEKEQENHNTKWENFVDKILDKHAECIKDIPTIKFNEV